MNRRRNFDRPDRNRGTVREIFRAIRDLFFPRKLAWLTVNGKSLTPDNHSKTPTILAIVAFLFVVLSTFLARESEAEMVEFSSEELQAAYTLVRPETTTVRLHGRQGFFEPAPALRYFGVEPQIFDIDLNALGNLVDVRFDDVVARMPILRFTPDSLEIEIPFEDRVKGIRSTLGAISLKGVSLTAILHWKETSGGARELKLKATRFKGSLKGTGALRLVTGRLKSLAMSETAKQVNRALSRPEMQQNILNGLSQWGKITLGDRRVSANPGTLSFFRRDSREGIQFETLY